MDLQVETLLSPFAFLAINENIIIKIQKWYRGYSLRIKQLPLILYKIQKYLKTTNFQCSTTNDDGRLNSCEDENNIIELLTNKFGNKIKTQPIRKWFDILAYDYFYGWIPINIKTTTTKVGDNSGNLAMCVYAYTDELLNIHSDGTYDNRDMHDLLFNKLKNKHYNKSNKKDYYFLVINKTDTTDIIINNVKGLTVLTPNLNNLPFQICWKNNKLFKYEHVGKKIKLFVECLQSPARNWKETFLTNMRTLHL